MNPAGVMLDAWRARSVRERVVLGVACLLAAACLATSGVQALSRWRASAADRLSSAAAEHRAVRAALDRRGPAREPGASRSAPATEIAARRAAETLGLEVSLGATGEGVAFRAEGVGAPVVFGWLSALEKQGVRPGWLSVDPVGGGLVTAEGLFAAPPP